MAMRRSVVAVVLFAVLFVVLIDETRQQPSDRPLTPKQKQRNDMFVKGTRLLAEGKLLDAETELRAFVAKYPGSPGGFANLGLALWGQKKLPEAYYCLKQAYEKGGGFDWQTRLNYGLICLDIWTTYQHSHKLRREMLKLEIYNREAIWKVAREQMLAAIATNQANVIAYMAFCSALEERGELDEAVKWWEHALNTHGVIDKLAELPIGQGKALQHIALLNDRYGNVENALNIAAIGRDKKSEECAWLEVELLARHGLIFDAQERLNNVVEHEFPHLKNSTMYNQIQGNIHSLLGASTLALAEFTKAIDGSRGSIQLGALYNSRALEKNWIGDFEGARADLRQAWITNLEHAEVWALRDGCNATGRNFILLDDLLSNEVFDWVQIEYVTNRDTRYELHTHTLRQSGVEVPVRAFEPQLIRRVTLSDVVVFGTTGIIRHKCTYVMTDAALQMLPDFKRSKSPFQVKPKPLPEAAMVHNYNAPFDFQHLLLHDAGKIITLFDTETISEQSKLLVPVMHPNTDTKFHAMFELLRTLGIPAEHVKSYEPHRNEYIIKKLHLVLSNFADYRVRELQSAWYAPPMLLKEVRSRLIGTPLPSLDKCTHVTYVSRPQYTPRSVVNETELTDALRHTVQALGYSFSTVTISSQSSLHAQIEKFGKSCAVIGPHGEGLASAIFSPRGAALIELPVVHGKENVFGHLAAAIGLDYWVVPAMSAFKEGTYSGNDHEAIEQVLRVVRESLGVHRRRQEKKQQERAAQEQQQQQQQQHASVRAEL